jgi:hypothetical protein
MQLEHLPLHTVDEDNDGGKLVHIQVLEYESPEDSRQNISS